MPRNRWELTRAGRNEYFATAKWLAKAGAAIEISKSMSEPRPLRIDQYGPEFNQIVFNVHQFAIGVVVGVRLLASKPGITICDCHFALHGEDIQPILLGISDESPFYRLTKGLGFPREEVLNHRIDEGLSLRAGKPVDGLLIATGSAPLPTKYCHRAPMNVELTLVDQFDNDYSANIELLANRRLGGTLHVDCPRKGSTLYDREESTFEDDELLPKNSNELRLQIGSPADASGSV